MNGCVCGIDVAAVVVCVGGVGVVDSAVCW